MKRVLEHFHPLDAEQLVLASGSPRRKEILGRFLPSFRVMKPGFREPPMNTYSKSQHCALALGKADSLKSIVNNMIDDTIIAAFDTVVICRGRVLGKPSSKESAIEMLHLLSNRSHRVITQTTLLYRSEVFSEPTETEVTFKELSTSSIERYVRSGEPFDKAGGYGIQGLASLFVSGINGCYFNVVGLPVFTFESLINKCGRTLLP